MSDNKRPRVTARVIKSSLPVKKAETSTQLIEQETVTVSEWLEPPADLHGYKTYVTHSSILPQCIKAYKNNIAGFGIGIRYKDDYAEETSEMKEELNQAQEIIELLNMDMNTKELFEDIIEARETYGIAYAEVIRNAVNEVIELEFIKDTPSMRKTIPLDPYIDIDYSYKGRIITRPKRFCKYRQKAAMKTVYFKEFGDPRIMNKSTGKYLTDNETLSSEEQANEIIEFAIGTESYGEVRWIGQVLGVDGSRKAENLNNRYFEEGRHTPLLITIEGGTLTDESFSKLQEYMNDIKGEKGQHAFMVLETEDADNKTDLSDEDKPKINIHNLASILQKDELFQDYLENNRRKVQSSFQLPDLYVGYTTEFNRATAQTAQEITEKQVFQPERASLSWVINNKLLSGYYLKYVEAYFLAPDITDPDDLYKLLTVGNNAGGLTPNKAKEIIYKAIGQESEDYPEDWGDIPLAYTKTQTTSPDITQQLSTQIQKAQSSNDDAVVAVMKEVRTILLHMQKEANA